MDALARFGPKVDARPLLEQDRATLLRLVRDLDAKEWERPTAAAPWLVRDVVAHLLCDDLSRLARTRDCHSPVGPQQDEPLAAFIHRFNDADRTCCAVGHLSPLVVRLRQAAGSATRRTWGRR